MTRAKRAVALGGLCALMVLLIPSAALASHARPKSASPVTVTLVPAFDACLGASPPGMTHGAPLVLPSCSPPTQTSQYLTMQAPDRSAPHAGVADGAGALTFRVVCHAPGTTTEVGVSPCTAPLGEQIDVRMSLTLSGVRCTGAPGQTHGPHGGPLVACAANELYDGMVLSSTYVRISDHYNGIVPNPPGSDCSDTTSCPGTLQEYPLYTFGAQCIDGVCNYVTSSDLVVTDISKEGKRAVVGLGQITVDDAGQDGDLIAGPPPTTGICPPTCAQNGDGDAKAFTQGALVP